MILRVGSYKPVPFTGGKNEDPAFDKALTDKDKFVEKFKILAGGTYTQNGTNSCTVVIDDENNYCIKVTGTSEDALKHLPDSYGKEPKTRIIKEVIGVIPPQDIQRFTTFI
ncbi:MAG: hypothetical protein HY094_04505 [Candidatus Melainabacteria bacterium]|nr:hypothetical protein [Candidatus Melainabacteria bacterium]